jgi:hypothetical protein
MQGAKTGQQYKVSGGNLVLEITLAAADESTAKIVQGGEPAVAGLRVEAIH